MALRRILLVACALLFVVSCGRSNLGFGDGDSARRPGQSDTGIRPDATTDGGDAGPDVTPDPEICDDGVDNDGDGLVDCDDGDCIADAACQVADCPQMDLGESLSADGFPVAEFVPEGNGTRTECGDDEFDTMSFAWSAPFDGTFQVFVDGPVLVLEIRSGTCAGSVLSCSEPFGNDFEASEGDAFVFVVEGAPDLSALFIFGEPTGGEEICFDGVDNDGDGLIDCDDPDCFDECGPDFEFDCFDGVDNDRDGAIDCDDFDCRFECGPGFEFDCANGLDDDGDGAVDCADPDCEGTPECFVECPALDLGSETGRPIVQTPAFPAPDQFGGRCGGVGVGEIGVSWTAPATGVWTFSTEGSEGGPAPIYLKEFDCFGPDLACSADGVVEAELFEGQRVVLLVEGFDGSERLLNLSIFRSDVPSEAGFCDDFRDNDGDGLIDCRDPDCVFDPACDTPAFENCANGIDDDGDRLIDCDDPDCDFSPFCAGFERICDNGVDDDRDGRTDCDDPDCAFDPFCGADPEVCFNGIDDDGDRLIDCNDPDCFDDPACIFPEVCNNFFDDDRDGLIDCDDPDCARDPACRPDVEICFNGRDDDFDRLVDCDDPDCFDEPECDITPSCPDGELAPAVGVPVATGSTVDAGNDASGSCGGGRAPERAFAWTAPFDGTFRIDTVGSSFDTVLYVRRGGCEGPELACDDDTGGTQSAVEVTLAAGEPVTIFVDGFGANAGPFALSIREAVPDTEEGLCTDGLDNDLDGRTDCGDFDCRDDDACAVRELCSNGDDDDGDGLVDCDDPDCFGDRACRQPENCFNGVDDDRDGLIDCDDPDCIGLPICFGDEVCFNGVDDDGDGLVDCDDPDCEDFPTCVPGPEICDNGIDDDDDGLIDCNDRECRLDPACAGAEICFNGVDDDRDGRVDCADPDCFGSPFCETPFELCANGVDDDGDGLADCEDPDCFGDPACEEPTCPAVNLGNVVGSGVARGTTVGGTNDGGGSCGGDLAPDVTFSWRAPAAGAFVFDTDGSDYDTIMHIRNGTCDGAELACDDDGIRVGGASRIELSLRRNQTVVIFVDGWNNSTGTFQLNINAVSTGSEAGFCADGIDNDDDGRADCDDPDCFADPSCIGLFEICFNGIDDDFDGRIDCDDPDCEFDPSCGADPEICFDRIDNDGDGRIDCDDPDCFDSPLCFGTEICDNGFDDDRNGLVDCDDPACEDDPDCLGPQPEICTDGIDNDLDGRIDCGDTDCFIDPACFFSEICDNGIDDDDDGLTDCADPSCFFDPACPDGEICTNGIDDDGDGAVDCDDPECVFDPFCAASEDCTNGIDDDGDGFIDCADLTCVLDPTCQIPENCFNDVDDDGDGFVDCDDSECADVPSCAPPACPNGSLGNAIGNAIATGSTSGAGNDVSPSCGGGSAEDVAFTWSAPRAGRYAISTVGSGYDALLAILAGDSCEGEELFCDDDTPPLGRQSRIIVEAAAGETFTIVIAGFATSSGDFVLNITRVPTNEAGRCANGDDDDLDGQTDCDDPDCFDDAACVEAEDCLNGIDDDRDGLTDCDDPDCDASPFCFEVEDCGNGVDDDGDGAIDCDDADCEGTPLCLPPEDCTNGEDDDRDGAIDCDDSDCAGAPSCIPVEICDNGIDDDGDRRVDCDDADCFDDEACAIACPDFDLGSALGAGVATGDNTGFGNDVDGSCIGGAGEDVGFAWTAPVNGRFRFDTFGSSFDTQIHIRLGSCEGAEVVCNDDTGGTQSSVELPLTAGSEIVIFVDGFGTGSRGDYILNITRLLSSEAGVCLDGVDNDGDGTTDCDDADCFTDDACITPEVCFNGEDDDRDGAIDCDDPDCFGFPTCGEPEICDNGIDDDLDSRTDCEDADCADDPACSTCPATDIGTSTGEFVVFEPLFDVPDSDSGSCSPGGGELSVQWTAPGRGRYEATTAGSPGPIALYARSGGCDGSEIGCAVDFGGAEDGASFLFTARAGQTIVFFLEQVEGIPTEGALSIRQIPTNEAGLCLDGLDNDADGATDCDDPDCMMDAACALPEFCDNGVDDDFDGATDCEDEDCFGDPFCISEDEICGNGIDDDADGATDCADSECILTPECIGAENCTNGIDDDANGRTDCEDPVCSVDPACFFAETCNNGVDDDGDGLVDCDDPSCAFRPECADANTEDCSNGVDDDGDGQVDCDDFGCLISLECLPFP